MSEPTPQVPKNWKEMLLQSRIAKYPLATVIVVIVILALLWWLMPDFVRFLAGLGPAGPS